MSMKERPILFSGDMVRALMDGRKTQTRRVVKLPRKDGVGDNRYVFTDSEGKDRFIDCPYGEPGDRLWVRETWADVDYESREDGMVCTRTATIYRADGVGLGEFGPDEIKWRPSIFMPRLASRITLEITGVRVQRLQDISEEDAIAEGIHYDEAMKGYQVGDGMSGIFYHGRNPRISYRDLWDSINGELSWELNPWVWVVEFRRVGA